MNVEQKLDREISTLVKTNLAFTNTDKFSNLTFNQFLSNKMLIISTIQKGIPYKLFDLIKSIMPFTESDWANFLGVSTKTLQRYKQPTKNDSKAIMLKSIQSEKIIELAEVTNVGKNVFGSMEKFKLWLDTPNFALGNMKPMELLNNSYGKEMIIGELNRIEHGIFI
jgi:putative toxin-antitoxin system antitoxin component (TIGR02293 family)